MLDFVGVRIDEFALDAVGNAVLLELDTEIRSMGGVSLLLPNGRRRLVEQASGRIVVTHKSVGRVLCDPRHDGSTLGQEPGKPGRGSHGKIII